MNEYVIPIEAKREREDGSEESSDESDRAEKIRKTESSALFEQHKVALSKTQFYNDEEFFEGIPMDTEEDFIEWRDQVWAAETSIFTADVSYLSIFPNLKFLMLRSDKAVSEKPLRAITMNTAGIDKISATHLIIHSRNALVIEGMSPAFCASLGKIVDLKIQCPIRLWHRAGTPPASMNLGALKTLSLGAIPYKAALDRMTEMESFIDVTDTGYFAKLSTVTKLTLVNFSASTMDTVTQRLHPLQVEVIAPSVKKLKIQHMGFIMSTEWTDKMPLVENLSFTNTSMDTFQTTMVRGFRMLKKLKFSNTTYTEEEAPNFENTVFFIEFTTGFFLYDLPLLQRLIFRRVNIAKLILGAPGIDEIDERVKSPPFASLNEIFITQERIENGSATELKPTTRVVLATQRRPAEFLPKLSDLELDGDLDEEAYWTSRDEMEEPAGFFPRFVLGLPDLQWYRGPLAWGHAVQHEADIPEIVDVGTYVLPSVSAFPQIYLDRLNNLVFNNLLAVTFTSSLPALAEPIARFYDAEKRQVREERLHALQEQEARQRLEEERKRQRELTNAQAVEQIGDLVKSETRDMDDKTKADILKAVMSKALERLTVPKHRHEPYFVRYSDTTACHTTMVVDASGNARPAYIMADPFAIDARGRGIMCSLCGEAFDRAVHDADAAEITSNEFLTRRNLLEIDLQMNRLGCVVVCNVLPSDFDRNYYDPRENETHQQAVQRIQCIHRNHFFHRVCFSTALYDNYEKSFRKYKCPHDNLQFYAVPRIQRQQHHE